MIPENKFLHAADLLNLVKTLVGLDKQIIYLDSIFVREQTALPQLILQGNALVLGDLVGGVAGLREQRLQDRVAHVLTLTLCRVRLQNFI